MLGSVTSLSLNPAGGVKTPYDVQRDLTPVSRLFYAPLLFVVNDQIKGSTVKQVTDFLKAHPEKALYASVGAGSSTHIAAELFRASTGVPLVHVPYKGSAPAMTDLVGGHVQLMFDGGTSALPHVASGKLRLLAVTTSKRFAGLPDVPTMAESGLPDYDVTPWWGIVAPAGTPPEIVERISKELLAITASPELRNRFVKEGVALEGSTPAEFAQYIRTETTRWTKFLKSSGISLVD